MMSRSQKLGVAAGIGAGSSILTTAALVYWVSPLTEDGDPNWAYENAHYLGGGASLLSALVLYKTWGSDEALVCAVTGVGCALMIPARDFAEEKRIEALEDESTPHEGLLGGKRTRRSLPAARSRVAAGAARTKVAA